MQLAAICSGVVAPIVLILAAGVVSAVQPQYDPMAQAVSDLGSPGAEWAAVMNIAFVCTGLLTIIFAFSFVLELGSTASACLALVFWGVAGLSLAGVGLLPYPHAHHVEVASYGALFACAGIIAGHFAIFSVFRAYLLWFLSPIAASSTLLFFFLPFGTPGRQGFLERIFLLSVGAWQIVAGVHLLAARRVRSNNRFNLSVRPVTRLAPERATH